MEIHVAALGTIALEYVHCHCNPLYAHLKIAMRALVVCMLRLFETLSKSPLSNDTFRYSITLRASTARWVPPARSEVFGLYLCVRKEDPMQYM